MPAELRAEELSPFKWSVPEGNLKTVQPVPGSIVSQQWVIIVITHDSVAPPADTVIRYLPGPICSAGERCQIQSSPERPRHGCSVTWTPFLSISPDTSASPGVTIAHLVARKAAQQEKLRGDLCVHVDMAN
ncbi:hypothetical protein ACOMHN_047813 [Nucella lapillus]